MQRLRARHLSYCGPVVTQTFSTGLHFYTQYSNFRHEGHEGCTGLGGSLRFHSSVQTSSTPSFSKEYLMSVNALRWAAFQLCSVSRVVLRTI